MFKINCPSERNGFKTSENIKKLNVHKKIEVIPDISTELVKKRAKELSTPGMNYTFNDILLTAISKTMNDYL